MATFTVSIGPQSDSKTISNADITRIINAAKAKYGSNLDNAGAFTAVVNDFYASLRALVNISEEQTARQAIVDISIT